MARAVGLVILYLPFTGWQGLAKLLFLGIYGFVIAPVSPLICRSMQRFLSPLGFSSMGRSSLLPDCLVTQRQRLLVPSLLGAWGMMLLAAVPVFAQASPTTGSAPGPATTELTVEAAGQLPNSLTHSLTNSPPNSPPPNSLGQLPQPERGQSRPGLEAGVGVAPLPAAPLDLGPPPEAPLMLDQVPLEAKSRVANRRLVIRLAQRRVYVYEGKNLFVSYPIAIGREGWETPKGEFKVFQMIQDPSWQHPWNGSIVPPGPDNPLGRRWIGFWTDGTNAIGFHGTPNESLVGQAVSHGCIRMKNADVQNLFAMVGSGTTVLVE
jgi:L,D-transpeptidase ErfK/SrfK